MLLGGFGEYFEITYYVSCVLRLGASIFFLK